MSDRALWEIQKIINENHDDQIKILTEELLSLIDILKDHEGDMVKMATRINELEKKLSKYEES